MSRRWLAIILLLAACTTKKANPPVNLRGTYDLAQVGDRVFVTSTDRSELRVLDLSADPRGFVRAPNPLEYLSIPVVERPVSIARDVRFENGAVEGGPLVYVRSQGTKAISIVNAVGPKNELVELARHATQDPVSALAGLGRSAGSTLWYATFDGSTGTIWALPGLDRLTLKPATSLTATSVLELPGEAVISLLAIPASSSLPDNPRIVVATRSLGAQRGRTFVLDTTATTTQPLEFPWPVIQLSTLVQFSGATPSATWIFGALDTESCGGDECRGVLGVDASSGAILPDASGQPMLPLRFGDSLVSGLDLAFGQPMPEPALEATGVFTASSGEIVFFDAVKRRHIDVDPRLPAVESLEYQDESGAELPFVEGPVLASIALADGAARTESITFEHQGLLPGLVNLPTTDLDGARFPAGAEALARAQVGDLIAVSTAAGICGPELAVASIETDALVVAAAPGPECAGRTSFSVRAAGTRPWVVQGSESGYLGRAGNDQAVSFAGSYFQRPDGFDAARPQLSFTMGPGDPAVRRGVRYVLRTSSGFLPLAATIDTQICTTCTLPSSVALDPTRGEAYVSFPSASALVQIDTTEVAVGKNSGNIVSYR